jgi:hypothetical protein
MERTIWFISQQESVNVSEIWILRAIQEPVYQKVAREMTIKTGPIIIQRDNSSQA